MNKKITKIEYNYLNLPDRIEFEGGSTVSYLYDAVGTKLRAVHSIAGNTTTTDYCGNVIFENGSSKTVLTEAGYVSLNDNKYHYYLQDHQGNNRVVTDQNGTIEEAIIIILSEVHSLIVLLFSLTNIMARGWIQRTDSIGMIMELGSMMRR